jgi:hypothetical protein
MPRPLVLAATTAFAAFAASAAFAGTAASASTSVASLPLPLPLPMTEEAGDQFTVTVADSGAQGADGTYRLTCRPTGGTHKQAQAACDRLAELARGGRDPFAPVSGDAPCTLQYGGPASARVTGSWQGRPIDASFNKKDGCEIARWRALEPVLPGTSTGSGV